MDDCIPAPETQDGEWCATPEPTYGNPQVPWPMPGPIVPLLIAGIDLAGRMRVVDPETGGTVSGPWDTKVNFSPTSEFPYDSSWGMQGTEGAFLCANSEAVNIFSWGVARIDAEGNTVYFTENDDWTIALAVNPDGKRLLVVTGISVYVLDIETGDITPIVGSAKDGNALDLTWAAAVWTSDDNFVVSSSDIRPGKVMCFDLDGNLIWEAAIPGRSDCLALHGGYIYAGDSFGESNGSDTFVHKIRESDGVEETGGLFPFLDGGARKVAVRGDRLYIGDHANVLTCIDLVAGTVVYQTAPFGDWVYGLAVDADQNAYIGTSIDEGKIHKIDPDGNLLWSSEAFFQFRDLQDIAILYGEQQAGG